MTKKKILTISDHPLSPSGVGIQTRIFIESLLNTGRYRVVSLGGAMKHPSYQPKKVDPYGDDWTIYPVDGYGTADHIRSLLRTERPDVLWFMTDPRFFGWLWNIENEIRPLVPLVYYHVWDNYPYPVYNKKFYESNDTIVSISKVTHDIVSNVAPDVNGYYLPHSVDDSIFKPFPEDVITKLKSDHFGEDDNKFTFFWNNRNARRKQSGSLVWWFKEFLDEVGHDKARLIMHTDPADGYGQDLEQIVLDLGITDGQVQFSNKRIDSQALSGMYNMSDCVLNISDAEGFGLSTFEALSCATPIVVTMTGGLQEQVTDGENWFGIGLEPNSKSVIGSQEVPYIYEDRISKEAFIDALKKMINMPEEERKEMGQKGREHVLNNYSFENYKKRWVEIMDEVCENQGSWEERKNYNSWKLAEVK